MRRKRAAEKTMRRKTELSAAVEGPQDGKKLILRFVAFAVCFCISIGVAYYAIKQFNKAEPGMQTIEPELDDNVRRFQNGMHFQHYFEGESSAIRLAVKTLNGIYSDALKDVYCQLNARETYEGRTNLASLNQNQGREVQISQPLYAMLMKADALSNEGVFNLYAGALYAEWEALRYQLEPADKDPVNDSNEAALLKRLVEATSNQANFSLEFLDWDSGTVRFTVDQAYLKLLEELDIADAPILDFNVLTDAVKLEMVADRLEEQGYDCGYLYTDSGLTLTLPCFEQEMQFVVYGQEDGREAAAAAYPVTRHAAAVNLRAFALEGEEGFYSLEQGGKTLLRHPWLPADGKFRECLLSAFVVNDEPNVVDTMMDCLRLFACDDEAALRTLAASLHEDVAYLLRSDPKTVHASGDKFLVNTAKGFTLAP